MKKQPQQIGFSLLEFLVAASLGLIVMFAIGKVFLSARHTQAVSEAKARMQEGARLGVDAIQKDIRMAGYMGCVNDGARIRNNELFVNLGGSSDRNFNGVSFADNFSRSIEGFEATGTSPTNSLTLTGELGGNWTPALPTPLVGKVAHGSDVMVVRYLGPRRARITNYILSASGASVTIDGSVLPSVEGGKTYAISDCNQVSFFKANGSGTSFTASGVGGNQSYSTRTAYVYEVTSVAYYVGEDENGSLGLMRHDLNSTSPTEGIVNGVVSFQALYAWDTNPSLPDGAVDMEGTAQALATAPSYSGQSAYSRVGQVRTALLMSELSGGGGNTPG